MVELGEDETTASTSSTTGQQPKQEHGQQRDDMLNNDIVQQLRNRHPDIKVVVFDMDQTAVSVHSRGQLLRNNLDSYLAKATSDFINLVPMLYAHNYKLAIATHSDENEFNGTTIQPETHILGYELAKALVDKHFTPEIASNFYIVAYNPRVRKTNDSQVDQQNLIKRYHMKQIQQHFGLDDPSQILFFDDTVEVIKDCIDTCNVTNSVLVDAQQGFQLSDLVQFINNIK